MSRVTPDMLSLIFFVLFLAALFVCALAGARALRRQYRVGGGRSYADTVAELHGETERRGVLIAAWGVAQARRIAGLEKT
jgi:hypothetical protein